MAVQRSASSSSWPSPARASTASPSRPQRRPASNRCSRTPSLVTSAVARAHCDLVGADLRGEQECALARRGRCVPFTDARAHERSDPVHLGGQRRMSDRLGLALELDDRFADLVGTIRRGRESYPRHLATERLHPLATFEVVRHRHAPREHAIVRARARRWQASRVLDRIVGDLTIGGREHADEHARARRTARRGTRTRARARSATRWRDQRTDTRRARCCATRRRGGRSTAAIASTCLRRPTCRSRRSQRARSRAHRRARSHRCAASRRRKPRCGGVRRCRASPIRRARRGRRSRASAHAGVRGWDRPRARRAGRSCSASVARDAGESPRTIALPM